MTDVTREDVYRWYLDGVWPEHLDLAPCYVGTRAPPDVLAELGIVPEEPPPRTAKWRTPPSQVNGHDAEAIEPPVTVQSLPVAPSTPDLIAEPPQPSPEINPPQPDQATSGSDDGYTAQIITAMTAASIELPPTSIVADGKIHRFVSKPGTQKKNGWYVVHPDPVIPTWTFGDWSVPDLKKQRGKGTPGRELSPEEQAAFEQRRREQEEKVRAERDRAWKDAAIEAEQRWKKAKVAPKSHPYLKKQQIEPCGARIENGNLLIPMLDIDGKLWSLQEINEDWKSNQPGGRRKACFTQVGNIGKAEVCGETRDVLIVCEGFATAASLHQATGYAVFAAGDAHNLQKVAPILRQKYKDAAIIVGGDDDWLARYEHGEKANTGEKAAEKAAKAVDGILVLPWFNPKGARPPKATDFNDEHKLYGLDEVRVTIKQALDAYEETRKKEREAEPPPVDSPEDFGLPVTAGFDLQFPDTNKYGMPSATCANARIAIEALGIDCSYDVFHDRKLVGGHAIEQWAGELNDHACHMLRVVIKEQFGFDPGGENTHVAAVQLCLKNKFDPILEYLNGVRWDETPRIETWLQDYLGAEDTDLNRAIARLTLVAAIRRARLPGCKFDQIIVLEGPEGKGKSSAIEILAGKENFSDQTVLGLGDREQQEAVRGVWLYEIADLAGMSKADVDKTKAFASRQTDRARPAYGRQRIDQPRRCVFIATTNDDTYLKSQTGNRRFWPVKTGQVDLKALRRDRDQLWAEAAHLEANGASLTLPEVLWAEAATEQDMRRDVDPWDEMLAGVQGTICDSIDDQGHPRQEQRISNTDLLTLHLRLPPEKCTEAAAKHLGHVMRRLGWEKPTNPIRIGNGMTAPKVRGFRRPHPPTTTDE